MTLSLKLWFAAMGVALALSVMAGGPSLIDPATYRPLYQDRRAARVGDVVTVLVVESATAESRARSSGDRSFDLAGSVIKDERTPKAGISVDRDVSGEGLTSRSGSLRAQVSARVVEMLDSGDMLIRGEQTITINGEQQRIAVEGIARPWDISAENLILSTRLLNSKLTFVGAGWVDGAQQPGLLERIARFLGL